MTEETLPMDAIENIACLIAAVALAGVGTLLLIVGGRAPKGVP